MKKKISFVELLCAIFIVEVVMLIGDDPSGFVNKFASGFLDCFN